MTSFKCMWNEFYREQCAILIELSNENKFDEIYFFYKVIVKEVQAIFDKLDHHKFCIWFIEGNIGIGKSTYLNTLKPITCIIPEPLELWQKVINTTTGDDILVSFYNEITKKNSSQYSSLNFKFEILALFSKLVFIANKLDSFEFETASSENDFFCERSFLSDAYVLNILLTIFFCGHLR